MKLCHKFLCRSLRLSAWVLGASRLTAPRSSPDRFCLLPSSGNLVGELKAITPVLTPLSRYVARPTT